MCMCLCVCVCECVCLCVYVCVCVYVYVYVCVCLYVCGVCVCVCVCGVCVINITHCYFGSTLHVVIEWLRFSRLLSIGPPAAYSPRAPRLVMTTPCLHSPLVYEPRVHTVRAAC